MRQFDTTELLNHVLSIIVSSCEQSKPSAATTLDDSNEICEVARDARYNYRPPILRELHVFPSYLTHTMANRAKSVEALMPIEMSLASGRGNASKIQMTKTRYKRFSGALPITSEDLDILWSMLSTTTMIGSATLLCATLMLHAHRQQCFQVGLSKHANIYLVIRDLFCWNYITQLVFRMREN